MLAVLMLAAMTMPFAYVDLLPSGLWLYCNVHYFTWLMPGFTLFSSRDGTFQNILTMRMLPDRDGLRVISLSRPFRGPLHWQDPSGLATEVDPPPQRWRANLGFGWPCWLPPYACARPAPR